MRKIIFFAKNFYGVKWLNVFPIIYLVCRFIADISILESLKVSMIILLMVYFIAAMGTIISLSMIRNMYKNGKLYVCIHGKGKIFRNFGYYYLENDCTLAEVSKGYGRGKHKIISDEIDHRSEYQIISEKSDEAIHILKIN